MSFLKQLALSVDQLINVFVWSSYEQSFGYADECISARLFRLQDTSVYWKRTHDFLNYIVRKFGSDRDHCFAAFVDEFNRHQLPAAYQNFIIESNKI